MSTSSRHLHIDRDNSTRQPPPSPPLVCPHCQCALVNDGGESVAQHLKPGMGISKGSFGKVFEGRIGEEGSPVAVKRPLSDEQQYVFHLEENSYDTNARCLILEAQVLKNLSHPNIQRIFAYETDPAMMVIELHRQGNLSDFIKRHPEIASEPEWILRRTIELASAMKYAHSQPWFVSHGDLKSSNILISDAGGLIVMDFGNVQIAPGYPIFERTPIIGDLNTSRHAPEVIKDGIYGEKGDVYQTAIIMYELMTGTAPFNGEVYGDMYPVILAHRIARDGVRPEIPPDLAHRPGWHPVLEDYKNLMKKCWSAYTEERPSFAKLEDELTEILKEYKRVTQIPRENIRWVTSDSTELITAFVYVLPAIGFLGVIPLYLLHIQQRAPLTVSEVAAYGIIVSVFVVIMWRVWTVPSSPTAVDDAIHWMNNGMRGSARALPLGDTPLAEDTVAEEEWHAYQRSPFDVRQCPFSCDDLLEEEALRSLNLPVPGAETWNQMCLEVVENLKDQPKAPWCIQLHRLCTRRCRGSPTQQEWEDFQEIFVDHPEIRCSCRTWVRYEQRHNRCRLTRSETEEQSTSACSVPVRRMLCVASGLARYADAIPLNRMRDEDPASSSSHPDDFFAKRPEIGDDTDEEVNGLSRTSTGVLTEDDLY